MAGGSAPEAAEAGPAPERARDPGVWRLALRNKSAFWGGALLAAIVAFAAAGPFLTSDPFALAPMNRLKPPGEGGLFGTDQLGRDVFSRVANGARVSLIVGIAVASIAVAIGLFLGLVAGYIRIMDAIVMRVMDGLMSIPAILLAIAMISLSGASLATVVAAIVIPEIPRVVRLVRSVVLTVREEPYVEAAIAAGTPTPLIMARHVLPNTVAPLIVQATYICGSAMLIEAILGFLGAGIPPEIPSWGNIMSEGRTFFQLTPCIIFFPGICLAFTVLAVNFVGDGLRDTLDPRIARSMR